MSTYNEGREKKRKYKSIAYSGYKQLLSRPRVKIEKGREMGGGGGERERGGMVRRYIELNYIYSAEHCQNRYVISMKANRLPISSRVRFKINPLVSIVSGLPFVSLVPLPLCPRTHTHTHTRARVQYTNAKWA